MKRWMLFLLVAGFLPACITTGTTKNGSESGSGNNWKLISVADNKNVGHWSHSSNGCTISMKLIGPECQPLHLCDLG